MIPLNSCPSLSEEGLDEFRKLILLSCNQNVSQFFDVVEKDLDDVLVILDDWLEVKQLEADKLEERTSDKTKGVDEETAVRKWGVPKEVLNEEK